jgi:predicted DNA-binding transcriptional regulator AlpA
MIDRATFVINPYLLYELDEVMEILRVSRSKLYNLIGEKKIKVKFLGPRCPRVRGSVLIAFIESDNDNTSTNSTINPAGSVATPDLMPGHQYNLLLDIQKE